MNQRKEQAMKEADQDSAQQVPADAGAEASGHACPPADSRVGVTPAGYHRGTTGVRIPMRSIRRVLRLIPHSSQRRSWTRFCSRISTEKSFTMRSA